MQSKQPKIKKRRETGFSIRRKSGIIRDSHHGVKTRRGKKVFIDCPSIGCVALIDDIHQLTISCIAEHPFKYKIESLTNTNIMDQLNVS